MEIIKQIHAMDVHKEKELNGVMVIVNGLMDNVFQKRSLQQVKLLGQFPNLKIKFHTLITATLE